MREVKKPEKQGHEEWCDYLRDENNLSLDLPCDCGKINSDHMYNQWQAYHYQELAKEKAKRVVMIEGLKEWVKIAKKQADCRHLDIPYCESFDKINIDDLLAKLEELKDEKADS